MTTAKLYRKFKAGEISRDRFLYEVRRDTNLPWITNTTSFDDAVKILKNKSIISEMDQNVKTDPAVDRVNPYFLKKGVEKLLAKEKELTNDSYKLALNKAAKMLAKNPHAFDQDMIHNADEVEKKDAKLHTKEVKKGDLNDTANEMKKVKVQDKTKKAKKAKALKEAALDELTSSLKKKESINEDSHYKHNVGAEIHTPDGPGRIKEIVGSTFTIEMEDGSLRDYQINVIDKAIEKHQEKQAADTAAQHGITPDQPKTTMELPGTTPKKVGFDKQSALQKLKGMMEKKKEDKSFLTRMKDKLKKLKERVDIVKGRNASTGEEEVLATVPGGQGAKVAAGLKSKGATSATVKSVA